MTVLRIFTSCPMYTLLQGSYFINETCIVNVKKINNVIPNSGLFTYSMYFTKHRSILERTAIYLATRFKSTKHLDYSKVPKLSEDELEEQCIRGSGPGGQATNKTSNAVLLKHKPTGIIVKCHETRSLWTNKEQARKIMITKLDNFLNGEDSIENQQKRFMEKHSSDRARKRKKLASLKTKFKEREQLE